MNLWIQFAINVAGAALVGYQTSGTWIGAVSAGLIALAALLQTPPVDVKKVVNGIFG